jgi:hypothetical protein
LDLAFVRKEKVFFLFKFSHIHTYKFRFNNVSHSQKDVQNSKLTNPLATPVHTHIHRQVNKTNTIENSRT